MDWKKHISDDPETFKYREPETNMYYGTSNIMNYLEDCRVRKASVSDQDILDYEMVHRDVPQKLFFTIPGIYEASLDDLEASLKEWLSKETDMKEPKISIDPFKDKYIVVCPDIMVENHRQKKQLLVEFSQAYEGRFHDVLSPYILQQTDLYEEIPSMTNALYKNPAV